MTYKLITPPSEEPLTLDEAKAQIRFESADSDTEITAFIVAAREQAEARTRRALCTQTWELVLDAFPEACVLRHSPVQSVTSVDYLDTDGASQSLNLLDTILDKDNTPGYLVPAYGKAWPATYCVPNAVRVRYVSGYGAAADVPQSIKTWMLMAIATFDAQRASFISGQSPSALPGRFWDSLLDKFVDYS